MATVHDTLEAVNTVTFDQALLQAVARAKAVFPAQRCRIERGCALALAGAVRDLTHLRPRWYAVQSASDAGIEYDVVSNGQTVCNCQDYELHATTTNGHICKHGWAVLLVRWAQKHQPISPVPAPKYYATYYAPDGSDHPGIATLTERGYLFTPDDGGEPLYASTTALCLGGRVDLTDAQRAQDGNLVEKVCSHTGASYR